LRVLPRWDLALERTVRRPNAGGTSFPNVEQTSEPVTNSVFACYFGEQFAPLDRVIDPEMATVYLDNLDVLARTRRAKGHVALWASARLRA
jgi:hypothetical protein